MIARLNALQGGGVVSLIQYAVRQGGLFVAKVDVGSLESEDRARKEAMHYLVVYAQDGPCELWRRNQHRRWRPLGIRMEQHPPLNVPASVEGDTQ